MKVFQLNSQAKNRVSISMKIMHHSFYSSGKEKIINEETHQKTERESRLNFLVDHPDPLRLTEAIIVVAVLLLWCGTIIIFIRHSELLRIRHRDLPFRSAAKTPINASHLTLLPRSSEMLHPHSKAHLSSSNRLTPPPSMSPPIHELQQQHVETNEIRSGKASPSPKQTGKIHSFDFNASSSNNDESFNHDDKEQLLDPSRISSDIRQSLLDLHRRSIENIAAISAQTSYSVNDIFRREEENPSRILTKTRCIQESPV